MSQASPNQRLRPFRPQVFGRYILLMPISTGGMGEVFLAQLQGPRGFDKLCVIKKILPHLAQDGDFVDRFIDEARILVKLSHGSIAQVLDMGVHDGAPYIALEFVDGKDLRRVISRMRERNLPLPLSFVLSVMVRVLDALAYAHRKRGDDDADLNLVHRDVSPQNVLISYEGEVKVIDFGLAKSAMSVSKTNPSIVLGKFMYMSPEQARHKPVDRRSDLYAVGLCLWELVTGKNPFEDVPQGELMGRVGNPSIPPLQSVDPLCPSSLSEAVVRALAVDPAQRFQTAEEFRGRLQAILLDIDPAAGAETASRFMREAFGAEYAAERRMLSTVKDQARALQPDDDDTTGEQETAQNMPSPFAQPKATPIAVAALTMDDETPHASRVKALQPEALSFAPTPRTVSLQDDLPGDVHEKETLPAIQLKTPPSPAPSSLQSVSQSLTPLVPVSALPTPAAPPPASAAAAPIRARVVAKSFDNEPTDANAPVLALEPPPPPAPQPLPTPEASIVVDGLPSEPFRTEQEIPAQQPPQAPLAPRPSRPGLKAKAATGKVTKRQVKSERPGSKPPKPAAPSPPPGPQRTDTQVIERVVSDEPPASMAAPERKKKGGGMWAWFVIPALAVAAVGGYIAWDLYSEELKAQAEPAPEAELEVVPPTPPPSQPPRVDGPVTAEPAPADVKPQEAAPTPAPEPKPKETGPASDPTVDPSKRAPPRKLSAPAAGGSDVAQAIRALRTDFDRIVDESEAKKFKLLVHQLELDAEGRDDDPVFLSRVEALHAKIRVALSRQ